MIVSHEHKFIFLKTQKTAGTSFELAISQLCGPDDIIRPLTEIDEALRVGVRGAQNWRLRRWWGSPRPLLKRRWFKFTAEDYGFYHMPAAQARARLDEKIWRSYFKFARPQPLGPAGLVLSSPLPARESAALVRQLHASGPPRANQQL
jgi:hypothetical protein